MSGISGIYFRDGRPLADADLQGQIRTLAHRGPDGRGTWASGSVGFGHQMLWTTPESLTESLPLHDAGRGLSITADARLDNRDELFPVFSFGLRSEREVGDAELILRAYEKWGEHCPEHLLGDFTFAIWDEGRHLLFCARDHIGVKPFYYHASPRLFVFGSEIKALFAIPEVPRKLSEPMVVNYLTAMCEDTTSTLYDDVLRLAPAHSITISPFGSRLRQYWSLDPARDIRLSSDEAYAEALREVFADAVRKRLRSAFPVGSELSGGLDSSSIVCMARHVMPAWQTGSLHTFSATFPDVPQSDESQYIRTVVDQGGVMPHFVRGDVLNPLADIDRLFWHLDEPFWAPSMFVYSALYNAARGERVRVLLTGEDGDNAVGYGIDYVAKLVQTGRWIRAAREVSGLAATLNGSRWTVLKRYGLRPLVPDVLLRLTGREVTPTGSRSKQDARAATRRAVLEQWLNLTDGTIPYGCEMFDKAAAPFSIELRHPFLDRRLIEFCLAVPADQKLRDGWIRMILRRALEGILPEEIRWRGGKSTLTPNFNRALKRFGRDTVQQVIHHNPGRLEEYVDRQSLRDIYHEYVRENDAVFNASIWSTVTMGLWLRHQEISV